ncbi:recombinase family protein [Acutalibacter muris]|uniref:Recombinase family protein n=1 Tax=Acutalibacter muris TaxID=1796620 RepID=A0A1Z2XQA2_9FIRM|nr:recombinase family protein [Acutalibacter muris]ANU52752.1 hypothetical protein A4V00_01235 [Hungateiclostridiaceae bacterium KB18]ASB40581.1 hypothetical protein ADH66_07860 [Acutalibacter muris]QQR29861.1 recombinase family protein [Acutalibacter muris]
MKLSSLESKIFGKVCYGFRRDKNKRIEIVEQDAEIVREMFDLCLEGKSLEKIQEHLHKQGVPSPSGRTVWSRDVLNKLLNNYKYTFGIIDHATYFAVEEMKSSRCRNPNRNIEDDEEWNEQVSLNCSGSMLQYELGYSKLLSKNKQKGTNLTMEWDKYLGAIASALAILGALFAWIKWLFHIKTNSEDLRNLAYHGNIKDYINCQYTIEGWNGKRGKIDRLLPKLLFKNRQVGMVLVLGESGVGKSFLCVKAYHRLILRTVLKQHRLKYFNASELENFDKLRNDPNAKKRYYF